MDGASDGGGAPSSKDGGASTSPDASDAAPDDLSTDPKNCGFTGHVCEKTCTGGLCDPVALRELDADYYAVDGDSVFYLKAKSLYSGSVTTASSDTLIATVPAVPQPSNLPTFFTSKSYVFFETSTGGVTVDKSTHKVASFTFAASSGAFGSIVGNDQGVYWFDASELLWSVPMTGGTPKQSDSWNLTALAADETGLYFYGAPQGEDTFGVWMVDGSKSTQLAAAVDVTWAIQVGATAIYGVATSGSGTPECQQSSVIWSVPKTGSNGGAGGATNLYTSSDYVDPFVADDTSVVWSPCAGDSVVTLASKGGAPHTLVGEAAQVQLDGVYAYYTQPLDNSLTMGQLARVAR
ncbi:MAG TPA: hypothetical protein VGL81_17905 [Polyangiaceae bacterium]|jgi:hypothetical protein